MKKSLLILSMLAFAASSAFADTVEAGTAESPNYYLITTARGSWPYLTYSPGGLILDENKQDVITHLSRQTNANAYSVWGVYAGSEDGTVVIKNSQADVYLMTFMNADGEPSEALNAIANTTSDETNVYLKDWGNGTYLISLHDNTGGGNGTYYGLDATNDKNICGNWINGEGTEWTFTSFDTEKESYVAELQEYLSNVPALKTELEAGITAINAVTDPSHFGDVFTAYNSAISTANAALGTCFDGKICTLKNLRREAYTLIDTYYLAVNAAKDGYVPVALMADHNAQYTFKSVGDQGGYHLYNQVTNTYIGTSLTPTEEEGSAITVYPVLNSNSGFYGVAFPFTAEKTGNGFNENTGTGPLTQWSINDGGSIWAVDEVDSAEALEEAKNYVVNYLQPYVANVPSEIAERFDAAIENAKNLVFSDELATQAYALRSDAIADANNSLAKDLNGKIYTLKNLRREADKSISTYYLAVNEAKDGYVPVASMADFNAQYTFKTVGEEGGYQLYNQVTNTYIGTSLTPTEEEGSAITVYPVLNSNSGFYGVAFPFTAEKTGNGFNEDQKNGSLTQWSINDGGSIWAVAEFDPADAIADAKRSVVEALEPYIANVPAVAKILEDAIAEADNLTYSANLNAEAQAISTKAIEDANNLLKTAFNGKDITLKSLYYDEFVAVEGDAFGCGETAAVLALVSAGDGGYTIYNAEKGVYFAKNGDATTYVTNASEAQVYYPQLYATSAGNGVCFPSSADFPTETAGLTIYKEWGNRFYDFQITAGNAPFGVFAVSITGDTTEIVEIAGAENAVKGIYDLSGRKLSAPVKGINIINGKKVLVK